MMSRLDQNLVIGPEAFLTQKTTEVEGALAKGIFKTFFYCQCHSTTICDLLINYDHN